MTDLGGGRGWLNDGPAQSIFRIDKALGHRMQITEAGRTWAQQNEHYQRYLKYGSPIALNPNTPSIHQKGAAIDTNEGQNHISLLASHGWKRTVYRNGKLVEPWHFEYFPNEDRYRTSGGGASAGNQDTKNRQAWLNQSRGEKLAVDGQQGAATTAAYKRYQTFLRAYGYSGAIDGQWGAGTQTAHQKYYNEYHAAGGKLTVDGKLGPATIKVLQSRLGVNQDGEWGPATTTALQKWLGVTADGQIGPATISALQKAIGTSVDGQMGPNTIKALQASLNAGGFKPKPSTPAPTPTPTPTPPPASTKLTVDGQWGPLTIKAFQTRLGVTADGQLGPITWKAFQKAVGITQDGEVGPNTAKALQMNVGATVDGSIGPATIKKLQEFLNAGTAFKTVVLTPDPKPVTYPKPAAPTYPGATWWNHSPNSSPRRAGDKVQYFVVHHAADPRDLATQRDRFMKANDRNVSPNWLIGKDGSVSEIVPPDKYRAWTSGVFDYNAVTVETQNTSGDPAWGISEESHIAIAKLVAWASKRYGFPIDRTHVIGHREVPGAATACPGPSMDLDKIVVLAQQFAKGDAETPVEPKPEDPDTWTITLPKEEAEEFGRFLDKWRDLLP
ncbi:endolysin [Microbacterium phage Pumpernickel]|uniref:N-acetylmuramoyl-L-alanine amidase n=1 Tax=Microbacterium phage Pumpernickel TaxID=2885983 RepID=A0AAE9C2W4_9CAUD|nr:endolysin [Microbacterium phage Pumpernickel]UDL15932.1 endolysin [Microbacterium phage Pumpernickel]